MFVTLLAGVLSLQDGSLQLASAGHDAPLRVSADGKVEFIPVESSSPAGINDEAQYHNASCRLQPGDALVTYTDGVTEARNPDGLLFGAKRLVSVLAAATDRAPGALLTTITEAVDGFAAGAEQADDLTLLVLRFKGAGSQP